MRLSLFTPRHALAFGETAVSLMRQAVTGWETVARVPLDSPDFDAEMRALVPMAGGRGAKVALWLPSAHVLSQCLAASDTNDPAVAIRALTALDPATLCLAIMPRRESGDRLLFAADRDTVGEAIAHARGWGFEADAVSPDPRSIPVGGAVSFDHPALRRPAGTRAMAAAAVIATVIGAIGIANLWPEPEQAPPVVAEQPPSTPLLRDEEGPPRIAITATTVPQREGPAPGTPFAAADGPPRPAAGMGEKSAGTVATVFETAPSVLSLAALSAAPPDRPAAPITVAPNRWPNAATEPRTAAPGLDGPFASQHSAPPPAHAVARLAGLVPPRPFDLSPGRPAAALGAPPMALPASPALPTTPDAAPTVSRSSDAAEPTLAPQATDSPAPPPPAPAEPEAAAAAAVVIPPGLGSVLPPARPPQTAEASSPVTGTPVLRAPRPVARPAALVAEIRAARARAEAARTEASREAQPARQPPVASGPRTVTGTPADVARTATIRQALRPGETGLLGVFGQGPTRQALLRLSDGRVQRVSSGDRVEGWTVGAIDDASVRLVGGNGTRTLRVPAP